MGFEREQIGSCTLYRGRAEDVLPTLTSVDIVLTDPPWAINSKPLKVLKGGIGPYREQPMTLAGGSIGFWQSGVIEWCVKLCKGNTFFLVGQRDLGRLIACLESYRGTFVWQRPNAAPAVIYPAKPNSSFIVWAAQKSALYGYQHWPSMVFRIPAPTAGCFAGERLVNASGKALHPAQGPILLYAQLLAPLPHGNCLDPFMGTGTTGVACIHLGHSFIGIEIEPRYFDIACKRIEAANAQLNLFVRPPVPRLQQEVLFA